MNKYLNKRTGSKVSFSPAESIFIQPYILKLKLRPLFSKLYLMFAASLKPKMYIS